MLERLYTADVKVRLHGDGDSTELTRTVISQPCAVFTLNYRTDVGALGTKLCVQQLVLSHVRVWKLKM